MKSIQKLFYLSTFLLLAAPLFAQKGEVIAPGFDLWQTVGSGATKMDFSETPLPGGFFGEGSEPYTGTIEFEGVPIKTEPAAALGGADTVVERLDWAEFDGDTARSRLKIKALHLRSRAPLVNDHGVWEVRAGLAKKQPATEIIYKRTDSRNGTFSADLVLNVRLIFTNLEDPETVHTIERTVHFTRFEDAPYNLSSDEDWKDGFIDNGATSSKRSMTRNPVIDTDADGVPDSVMALTLVSVTPIRNRTYYINAIPFRGGWICPPGASPPGPPCIPGYTWHQAPLHAHMTLPICGSPSHTGGWCQQNGTQVVLIDILGQLNKAGVIDAEPEDVLADMIAKSQQ